MQFERAVHRVDSAAHRGQRRGAHDRGDGGDEGQDGSGAGRGAGVKHPNWPVRHPRGDHCGLGSGPAAHSRLPPLRNHRAGDGRARRHVHPQRRQQVRGQEEQPALGPRLRL